MAKKASKRAPGKINGTTTSQRLDRNLLDATPVIAVIYTGGTIGMQGYPLRPMDKTQFVNLLKSTPGFQQTNGKLQLVLPSTHPEEPAPRRIGLEFVGELPAIDSSRMTPVNWADIATEVLQAHDSGRYRGIVVLHGTDTLAWTASALSFLVGELKLPVVMTGSQAPLGHSRSDALRNLITAIDFASHEQCPKEVCIFFDQVLLRGNRATKCRSSGFDGFETPNFAPLGSAGTLLSFATGLDRLPKLARVDLRKWRQAVAHAQVLALRVYPGINTFPQLPTGPAHIAIVLEAYGAGTANPEGGLESWLRRAKTGYAANIVLRTQVTNGAVEPGLYDAAEWLKDLVIPGSDITSEACVAKLYYLLGLERGPDFVDEAMRASLCGEAKLPLRPLETRGIGATEGYEGPVGTWTRLVTVSDVMRLEARLASMLAQVPEAIVAREAEMNGVRLDIAVIMPSYRIGIECSGGTVTGVKARRDIACLKQSGVERRILIAFSFTNEALGYIAKSGGSALTWDEALNHDWNASLNPSR